MESSNKNSEGLLWFVAWDYPSCNDNSPLSNILMHSQLDDFQMRQKAISKVGEGANNFSTGWLPLQ